ncbi:hypothetical protein [Halobaculum sp. EA56]|uniref:hypothetical protein n=1 Tax=Halobaculum sp. EA56 TaxID=3421648 RepID=UPI003EB6F522
MARTRAIRDALLGPLFALLVFTYRQFVLGNPYVAAAGAVGVLAVGLAYRYVDAHVIEAAVEAGDVEDIKPVLRRLGRWVRRRRKR